MMSLLPGTLTFASHKQTVCDYRTYTMYRNGLSKTARRAQAIELLKAGWYDNTKYQPKEEVLHYETEHECNEWGLETRGTREAEQIIDSTQRQHEDRSGDSDTCSIGQEPRHEQHQSYACDQSREEPSEQAIRSGSKCSEVKKTRGRPKRGK